MGATSRQRCALLWSHRPRLQTGEKKPRGTAWGNEKRRRLALIDPAANLGFSGVLSEPQRPRGHFGIAVPFFFCTALRIRILESRQKHAFQRAAPENIQEQKSCSIRDENYGGRLSAGMDVVKKVSGRERRRRRSN